MPALDGLRGVAILLVVAEHARVPGTRYFGTAGVLLFFVLSGYLITGLLLAEKDRSGTIRLGAFFLRRAARLVPALSLMLAAVVLAQGAVAVFPAIDAATYTANYHTYAWGGLAHTWSLAVEVHLYIVWSLALLMLPRRWIVPVAAVGVAVSLGLRHEIISFATEDNAFAFLAGAILAARSVRLPGPTWRPLAHLGRISYGVYLWHWPLIVLNPGAPPGLMVAASLVLAEASWRYVERPIIGLSRRAAKLNQHRLQDVAAR